MVLKIQSLILMLEKIQCYKFIFKFQWYRNISIENKQGCNIQNGSSENIQLRYTQPVGGSHNLCLISRKDKKSFKLLFPCSTPVYDRND